MSRSYKKHYHVKDHSKGQKQCANQCVRRNKKKNLPNKGKGYKKLYDSWEICDWNWRWTKEEAIENWYEEEADHYKKYAWRHKKFKTLEKWLSYWEKCVRRK